MNSASAVEEPAVGTNNSVLITHGKNDEGTLQLFAELLGSSHDPVICNCAELLQTAEPGFRGISAAYVEGASAGAIVNFPLVFHMRGGTITLNYFGGNINAELTAQRRENRKSGLVFRLKVHGAENNVREYATELDAGENWIDSSKGEDTGSRVSALNAVNIAIEASRKFALNRDHHG